MRVFAGSRCNDGFLLRVVYPVDAARVARRWIDALVTPTSDAD